MMAPRRGLPDHEAVRRAIRVEYAADLTASLALSDFAVSCLSTGDLYAPKRWGLRDPGAVRIALGLIGKLVQQQHSVVVLAAEGMYQDSVALTRCMFEAMLAVHWLLRIRVKVRDSKREGAVLAYEQLDNSGKKVWQPVRLGTRDRALMYQAHLAYEAERTAKAHLALTGSRILGRELLRAAKPEVDKADGALGKGLAARVRRHGYSGSTIRDLAFGLGWGPSYISHYRVASWAVHATDVGAFATMGPDRELTLDIRPRVKAGKQLRVAAIFLIDAMDILDCRVGGNWRAGLAPHATALRTALRPR